MRDRETVIKALEHCSRRLGCNTCPYDHGCGRQSLLLEDAAKLLREQEPVAHAAWLGKETSTAYDLYGVKTWAARYKCSKCGFVHRAIEAHMSYSYCPSCGARMDEEIKEGEVGCLTGKDS